MSSSRFEQQQQQQQSQPQRIKVTLSAPRNSNDQTGRHYSAEPILLDDAQVATTTTGRTRSTRDEQLRRIASQRRPAKQAATTSTGSDADPPSADQAADQKRQPALLACDLTGPSCLQQQQQQAENPKQLAIYINGKIRSNSIFCRSTSSTSFSSILNRFHANDQPKSKHEPAGQPGESDTPAGLGSRARCKRRPKAAGSKCSKLRLVDCLRLRPSTWALLLAGRAASAHGNQASPGSASSSSGADHLSEEENSSSSAKSELGEKDESAKLAANCSESSPATPSYKLNPSSMFLKKAMRYYRLWIYCTNITILLGTLIFILSSIYVLSDFRFKLLVRTKPTGEKQQQQQQQHYFIQLPGQHQSGPTSDAHLDDRLAAVTEQAESGADTHIQAHPHPSSTAPSGQSAGRQPDDFYIRPSEPSVLLAYAAIALQAGLLQAIGCFGALRMKERWIQVFWYLIVTLTILDVVIVIYWLDRFADLKQSLEGHMKAQLAQHYGFKSASTGAHLESNFDKTITEIVDKIQTQSQCCGISNASDFESSLWRQVKVKELEIKYASSELSKSAKLAGSLISQIPLVPASCCRPKQPQWPENHKRPVIFSDDSQVSQPARVPAWSPSMAVERLDERNQLATGWSGSGPASASALEQPDDDEDEQARRERPVTGRPDVGLSKQQRRLLAKQANFNRRAGGQPVGEERLVRRWALESRVDQQGEVLSRLVSGQSSAWPKPADEPDFGQRRQPTERAEEARQELHKLQRLLLEPTDSSPSPLDAHLSSSQAGRQSASRRFRWPNPLGLSLDQYKTIEAYLLREMTSDRDELERSRSTQTSATQLPGVGQLGKQRGLAEGAPKSKRRRDAGQPDPTQPLGLRDWVRNSDPDLRCAPSSYVDRKSIFTRGCEPAIEAWLDSSAHIMFVTGFCILTVLKFCSVILLRLEIREMIHKIRVLKGMATEYNALHDLEAYLPRPSLCAQAAELTPSGVSAAIGAPAAAPSLVGVPGAVCGTPCAAQGEPGAKGPAGTSANLMHRIGGSFSEAVVAATAAAAAAQQRQPGSLLGGPLGCARAASMKTMNSLAPSPCPRSSSAHLQTAASLLTSGARLRCDPFASPTGVMSRRHTAISVCPALQHLIDRRATYVAANNPLFGAPGATQLASAASLAQHRHSAHTIQTNSSSQHLNPSLAHRHSSASACMRVEPSTGAASVRRHLGDASLEQQSSAESAGCLERQQRSSAGSNQLLSLMYPFKRQSSGGAQSADCNFCLEPALSSESRRSIH